MKISIVEVERVSNLARLALTPEETEEFTGQLGRILDYFEKLDELDVDGVEPTRHAIEVVNAFREDEVKTAEDPERLLDNAPDREDRFFKVPRIIE